MKLYSCYYFIDYIYNHDYDTLSEQIPSQQINEVAPHE